MKREEIEKLAKDIAKRAKAEGRYEFSGYNNEEIGKYLRDGGLAYKGEVIISSIKDILNNTRGIGLVKEVEGYNGYCSRVNGLIILKSPCREFVSLQNWLKKYAGYKLEQDSVRRDYVSGKRSYYEVDNSELLSLSPNKCKSILNLLRSCRSTGDKIEVNLKSDLYEGDRYNGYGEDREIEWDGYEDQFMVIKVKTPSGRDKKLFTFYAF